MSNGTVTGVQLQPVNTAPQRGLGRYLIAALAVAVATLITKLLTPSIGTHVSSLLLAAVMISAWYGGLGPGLLATGLAGVCSVYFFIEPLYSQDMSLAVFLRVTVFLLVAIVISWLNGARDAAEAKLREARANLERRVAHRTAELADAHAEQLRSEQRYRSFVAHSTEGIWRFELAQPVPTDLPENEQIDQFYQFSHLAECNDAMARMYGYSRSEEIIGARLDDLCPRHLAKNIEFHRAFIRSGYALREAESCELTKTGEQRYISNNLVGIIEDGKLTRVWGTQRDVTEAKQSIDALRQSEQRFVLFMRHLPGAAFIKDADGRVIYVNETHKQLMGWVGDEWLNKRSDELFPPEIADVLIEHDRQVVEDGIALRVIEPLPQKDEIRDYLVSKFPIRQEGGLRPLIGGIATDVTDLRRAEEAVRFQKSVLEAITEAAVDGILLVTPEGKWLSFNHRFVEMWGLPETVVRSRLDEEALKAVADNLVHPDEFRERVSYLYAHPEQSSRNERIPLRDGRVFSRSSFPIASPTGSCYGRVWFFRDITQEEEARNRLRRLASDLSLTEQRERRRIAVALHDQIGQFLALAEMKIDSLSEAKEQAPFLDELATIRDLIDESLTSVRSLTIELCPPILYEAGFAAAVRWLVNRFSQQHHVDCVCDLNGAANIADEEMSLILFHAMQELLFNVAKHARARRVAVSASKNDGHLELSVEDDGVGFATSTLGSQSAERDCFGLFNVRERLESIGALLSIDSEPGSGTRVSITVPLSRQDSEGVRHNVDAHCSGR